MGKENPFIALRSFNFLPCLSFITNSQVPFYPPLKTWVSSLTSYALSAVSMANWLLIETWQYEKAVPTQGDIKQGWKFP